MPPSRSIHNHSSISGAQHQEYKKHIEQLLPLKSYLKIYCSNNSRHAPHEFQTKTKLSSEAVSKHTFKVARTFSHSSLVLKLLQLTLNAVFLLASDETFHPRNKLSLPVSSDHWNVLGLYLSNNMI